MCFLLLSYEVENGNFRFCCRTNNHMPRKSRVVVSQLAFKAIKKYCFAIKRDHSYHVSRCVKPADFFFFYYCWCFRTNMCGWALKG